MGAIARGALFMRSTRVFRSGPYRSGWSGFAFHGFVKQIHNPLEQL